MRELIEREAAIGYKDVRPEVKAFAVLMERKLSENDHKGGWKDCNAGWLLERMVGELGELCHAFMFGRQDEAQASEAVDVAAFAMMFCDVLGQLPTLPASTRYAELERAARASLAVLTRCKEVLDSLECECDSYHGYVCPIHSDRGSVDGTIADLRVALANLDEAKADG